MDAFENLVASLFRQQHHWVWLNYKVDITKEEKRKIGKPSMPRPEIDVLAYRPGCNQLLWIECKSYLDSRGVSINAFDGSSTGGSARFRVFTDENYRNIVSARLMQQLAEQKLLLPGASLQYCLVAGHIRLQTKQALRKHFAQNDWLLYDDDWLKDELKKLASLGYENEVAIMVAKLLRKNTTPGG